MSSPNPTRRTSPPSHSASKHPFLLSALALTALVLPLAANATFPDWLQHIIGASTVESALYRTMQLPTLQALYPRPPQEAANELSKLIASNAANAELYQLRARADEQALNEAAADSDWKLYVAHSPDPIAARLQLADFYQRRLMFPQEIATLKEVAAAPPIPSETYLDPATQRSWLAFERILGAIYQQGLPPSETASTFNAFLARYPEQPAVYAAFLQFLIEQQDWAAAQQLIDRYTRAFPNDKIFPVRAQALLEFRRGNIDAALTVYDHNFQPLWPAELIQSYLSLLDQTHRQRAFVAAARDQLASHPDGPEALNALARIFYYDQQADRTTSAQQTLDAFRIARDARNAAWTPADLYTLANLSLSIHSYPEAARYNYALASSPGSAPNGEPAAQVGLVGLIDILLQAPEQPLAIGAQNLTLYRDIATLDQGPGYWNGILSLWLNGASPESEYQAETSKAQRYFHRAKAAELLATLDKQFPAAPERPALHAQLIRALADYGEPASTISSGKQFLGAFPSAPQRLDVANLMADAYARQNDSAGEFALYESLLNELAAKTAGLPLTSASTAPPPTPEPGTVDFYVRVQDPDSVDSDASTAQKLSSQPLAQLPARKALPEGTAYAAILDRYLGRLTATNQLPRALSVLRSQLDRNPNDPLLYERLATFFQQNNLSAEQEQIYQQAIAKFQQPSNYDKLARLYLREKKREAFADLTKKVTDIFSGTDLDNFFANVNSRQPIGTQLALQLDLYASKRFPHDLVFTRNLLTAYQANATRDTTAYESLLRRNWYESDDLRDQFLTYLSHTNKLSSELSQLQSLANQQSSASANPAALRELAEIDIFTSHYEQAAPLLGSVADLYPADADTGDQAISLYRSLAYLDPQPTSTLRAVALEKNLLAAEPDSPDRLATLGDLYAQATSTGGEDLVSAAPFWRRIPELHPNSTQGYLTTATIFWDYFQFDDAINQIKAARTRLHSPALFGYEAGAIEESRHDLPAAIAEYTNAVIHPIEIPRHFDSALGVIGAWLKPPSDAADSNFRSTAQSFLGSEEANARLVQLATRTATQSGVDAATAKAVADNPANTAALTLRADVLTAQHHGTDLNPLLTALFNHALDHTSTLDEAAAVGSLAQDRNLPSVYERALSKQADLTPDPLQKIELQYSLAQSLESHDDVAAASRTIDSVYAANPRILGVVRATTDFYVRTNRPARAITTLLDAAKVATPNLAHDFTLEAATHANQANDTSQARALGLTLLSQTPYDSRALDVIATSYARANDNAGLKQFYLAQLDAARTAHNLSPGARRQDIALLRRGLIPALTRLNDFPGATDQYLALLSSFPEDASLGQQAALYALQHNRQQQLLDFLTNTVKQSPRDSRFMILLATTESTFNNLPAAESAYSQAIAIRKDRVDLYVARADIELRLSQSDLAQSELAAADFQRLYALTYHDPAWLVRLAELRARQQRPADAVKALQTAYIEGHVQAAADYFTVAAQLERWNLLGEARSFAEQGVTLAGSNFLTPPTSSTTFPEPDAGAVIYARILARSGQADRALSVLVAARHAADVSATSPSVLEAELARQNLADEEAADFRKNFATQHRQTADQNLSAAIQALGKCVQTYYTPEQKQAFALSLDNLHNSTQPNANPTLALQAAAAAGLADREADWRKQSLPADERSNTQLNLFIALQQRRLQFSSLAHDIEAFAARAIARRRTAILIQSAQAFRDAGDPTDEARIQRPLVLHGNTQVRNRYFNLLLHQEPAALTSLAANSSAPLADAALNYTVTHGTEPQALAAVASRSQTLHPVWRPAASSLVQTYFATPASTPDLSNFNQSLQPNTTVAVRLAAPADPARQLTGATFFYYASRYGIFLSTIQTPTHTAPDPEDFLAAELEGEPASPKPYLNLARTYAEAHNLSAAVAEYNHALELSPSDPAIDDELALTLYRANLHDAALTHWRKSLAILTDMQQHGMYPESWFTSFKTITHHLGDNHLTATFHPQIEAILGPYLAKNANYRSNELLRAAYQASATPAEGANLILAAVNAATEPNQILDDLERDKWLSQDAREPLLLRQVEILRAHPPTQSWDSCATAYQAKLVDLYLSRNEIAKAQATFNSLPDKDRKAYDTDAIILAVRSNRLQPLLDAWRANPDSVPKDSFTPAISSLLKSTAAYKPNLAAIRPLREFVFDYKRLNNTLHPTDFLALAQLRIDTNDLSGALDLLRQLTLQPVSNSEYDASSDSNSNNPNSAPTSIEAPTSIPLNPYSNTDAAASLLEKNHQPADAIPFLQSLVTSVPWDASYRLRQAHAELAADARDQARKDLITVARDTSAPYNLRAEAASTLASLTTQSIDLGSQELTFLTHPSTSAPAREPYAADARIALASVSSTSATDRDRLLREAIAINPYSPNAARAALDLLLLQTTTANPSATLAILRSLQAMAPVSQPTSADDADAPDPFTEPASSLPALPSGGERLDLVTRIRLAALLSSANEREGNLTTALAYTNLAIHLAQDSPHPELSRHRDDLNTALLLAQRNSLRRPVLHPALDQPNQVRPRLTASNLSSEDSQ